MAQTYQIAASSSQALTERMSGFAAQLNAHRSRVLTTVLGISTAAALIVPPCYQNYKAFLDLGPGAVPRNPLGWAVQWIFRIFFARETLSTGVYDEPWTDRFVQGMPDKDAEVNRTRFLPELPQRKGERPTIAPFGAPQREKHPLGDLRMQELQSTLLQTLASENRSTTFTGVSQLEGHFTALYVASPIAMPYPARFHKREVCHMHVPADNSTHVTLSYADAKQVIEKGWGERHPLDGSPIKLGFGYVMVYAPRNDEDLEVLGTILRAGVKFNTAFA